MLVDLMKNIDDFVNGNKGFD